MAKKYTVAKLSESAPATLSAKVRETLAESGMRIVSTDGKPLCDIWLREDVPTSRVQPDSSYPLESGTLVGAVRFVDKDAGDFRDLKVTSGVYTLRYGSQPKDGIHEATGQFRDFLVLLSSKDDIDPARIGSPEQLGERGIDTTGGSHPAILYLRPPKEDRRNLPAIVHVAGADANTGLAILVAKTTSKGNEKTKRIQLELVTVGYALE